VGGGGGGHQVSGGFVVEALARQAPPGPEVEREPDQRTRPLRSPRADAEGGGQVIGELGLHAVDGLLQEPIELRHGGAVATTTALLSDLPSAGVDELVSAAGPGSGSPLAMVELRQMGGALARRSPGAGARATLPGSLAMLSLGVAEDETSAATARTYLESVERAVLPYRMGDYPNFVMEPADASRFFDTDTWLRLRQVKALYDPSDLFEGNHHIPPAELS
jgi:hypothetical protein